jgi:phenylacetate-CoA ligase
MDTYGQFFSRVLNPAWETGLRRRPTLRHQRYLEQTQWRSLDELTAIQAGELRRLLRHAYANVPYYRALFDQVGARPDDIRDASDLGRLPVLERDRARDTVEERTARAGAAVEIRKSTSGTMGRPLVFGYERSSEYWRQACKLRGYGWAGYHPGMRSLHFWGGGPPPVAGTTPTLRKRLTKLKVQADRALRREHYVDCGRRGSVELDEVIEIIKRERPEVMVCYSQAGADLARHVLQRNARSWGTIPVLCGAERLLPADRAALEQAFGDAVFETYGCREVMLISTECDAHDGQHVSMETLVVEVVVRDGDGTSRPARPGELGEVVVTDLTNLAMPFIRYANGDLAVAGKTGTCRCGRALPRLASVEGRVTETLVDGSGARVNGLVFNVVIAHLAHAIQQFQVVQRKDRSVTLRVVPTATFDAGIEGVLRATWERYLTGVPVTLELVGDLPISRSGKRQVVVVERE